MYALNIEKGEYEYLQVHPFTDFLYFVELEGLYSLLLPY